MLVFAVFDSRERPVLSKKNLERTFKAIPDRRAMSTDSDKPFVCSVHSCGQVSSLSPPVLSRHVRCEIATVLRSICVIERSNQLTRLEGPVTDMITSK